MISIPLISGEDCFYYDKSILKKNKVSLEAFKTIKKDAMYNVLSKEDWLYFACIEYNDSFYTSFQRTIGWIFRTYEIFSDFLSSDFNLIHSKLSTTVISGSNTITNVPSFCIGTKLSNFRKDFFMTNQTILNIEEILKKMYIEDIRTFDYTEFKNLSTKDIEMNTISRKHPSFKKIPFEKNLYFPDLLEINFPIIEGYRLERLISKLKSGDILDDYILRDIAINLIRLLSEFGVKKSELPDYLFESKGYMETDLFRYDGFDFVLPYVPYKIYGSGKHVPFEVIDNARGIVSKKIKNNDFSNNKVMSIKIIDKTRNVFFGEN